MSSFVLQSALRGIRRDLVLTMISIGGLAVGLGVVIIAGLVLRSQLNLDHFIPGYDRVMLVTTDATIPGRPTDHLPNSTSAVADRLRQHVLGITAAARLAEATVRLRRGMVANDETIYWADPNAFDVLPLPVVAGSLTHALDRPDAIVITRSAARRYFGIDAPLGQQLVIGKGRLATVTAVIADLPVNGTTLATGIFLSGSAPDSDLRALDLDPAEQGTTSFVMAVSTYVRLASGAGLATVQASMDRQAPNLLPKPPFIQAAALRLVPLDRVAVSPLLAPGAATRLAIGFAVALLILLVAATNFVNLQTARAGRRAREVGIRKAMGASRGALIGQFLGEAILFALLAMVGAIALTEIALPFVNAFLSTGAPFAYWRDPALAATLIAAAIVVGVASGLYPALVLSAFEPIVTLRGTIVRPGDRRLAREALVAVQFVVLIVVATLSGTTYLQQSYAADRATGLPAGEAIEIGGQCRSSLLTLVKSLPGVEAAACTSSGMLHPVAFRQVSLPGNADAPMHLASVGEGAFESYGIRPLAGRLFSSAFGGDSAQGADGIRRYVVNNATVRLLGLSSPARAIGALVTLPAQGDLPRDRGEIIGVVPDVSIAAADEGVPATIFTLDPAIPTSDALTNIRLAQPASPAILASIERAWHATGGQGQPDLTRLTDRIRRLGEPIQRRALILNAAAAVAVVLAALGLFGLSIASGERRTKEIGIRKAMGATNRAIIALLMTEFLRPVVIAAIVACPLAWLLGAHWLAGYSRHIAFPLLFLFAVAGAAMAIAMLSVATQATLTARREPVDSLRYE